MQFKNKLFIISFIITLTMIINQGCIDKDEHYLTVDKTTLRDKILSEMREIKNISKFTAAISQVDSLEELLEQSRLYTVFAPTDSAFDLIDAAILNNDTLLERMVLYHFINGKFKKKDMGESNLETFNQKTLNFSIESGTNDILLDTNTRIIESDILSLNGMIQVINSVLIPYDNLYESLRYNDYSKIIGDQIKNYETTEFIKKLSSPIGTNEYGQTVYDSVFNITNPLLYTLSGWAYGSFYGEQYFNYINIADEYDKFTVILPTNFANAVTEINKSSVLNTKISNKDLAGPILANLISFGKDERETLIADFIFKNSIPDRDTSELELYFASLLINNYAGKIKLSNGQIHKVDSFDYDLNWLIKEKGNNNGSLKETDYLDTLLYNITGSDSINNKSVITTLNVKTPFYYQDTLMDTTMRFTERYGDWASYVITGNFYPVDYKLMIRGKNINSGKFKIEIDDQKIADYDFETAPSDNDDAIFNEIGTVSFDIVKSKAHLKFTFLESHSGSRLSKAEQNLWIREIKLVPILE